MSIVMLGIMVKVNGNGNIYVMSPDAPSLQ